MNTIEYWASVWIRALRHSVLYKIRASWRTFNSNIKTLWLFSFLRSLFIFIHLMLKYGAHENGQSGCKAFVVFHYVFCFGDFLSLWSFLSNIYSKHFAGVCISKTIQLHSVNDVAKIKLFVCCAVVQRGEFNLWPQPFKKDVSSCPKLCQNWKVIWIVKHI